MPIRAKFRCTSKKDTIDGVSIAMEPVIDGSEENKSFFKYTPSGALNLYLVNKEASCQITEGHEYYLDITAAE